MTTVYDFDLGDSVSLVFNVKVRDPLTGVETPTNATVTLVVTKPDGSTSNPSITNAATGVYTATVAADQTGVWLYRWAATGAATTAEPGSFSVKPNVGATFYTTLPELKTALNLPAEDTLDDNDLQDAISVASRQVDADCGRQFYQATETRRLPASGLYQVRLGEYGDLVSVTSLKTDTSGDGVYETTWSASDYQLLCADGTANVNAGPEPRPFRRIKAVGARTFPVCTYGGRSDQVEITGVWGWPTVPDRIRRAARLMAAEVFRLRDAPFGAVGMADLGIVRVRENPKYLRLISDYRLWPVPVA